MEQPQNQNTLRAYYKAKEINIRGRKSRHLSPESFDTSYHKIWQTDFVLYSEESWLIPVNSTDYKLKLCCPLVLMTIDGGATATYVSVLTISAFSLERYLAICHPLHLYAMAGLTRASRIILVLWVISIACASPFAIYSDISYREYPPNSGNVSLQSAFCALMAPSPLLELSSIFFFFVPGILILCLYVRMGLHIRSTRVIEKTKVGLLNGHIHGETQAKSRKAIIRML
ncbi:hypothetical protein ACJJTC_010445, partial [Scirpophaga incertulas]